MMALDLSIQGEQGPEQTHKFTDGNDVRELVATFMRNRTAAGTKRHDVVFRNLTVRGAGIGVSAHLYCQ